MLLPEDTFRTVVAATPLISIDLVVTNPRGEILLGRRNNRPAQGCWFVPGGRVLKDESLDEAFARLTGAELGRRVPRAAAHFLSVYEHFYSDSVFGATPTTHYVVLAYQWQKELELAQLPDAQHNDYRWWAPADMVASEAVHSNSRAYLPALAASQNDR